MPTRRATRSDRPTGRAVRSVTRLRPAPRPVGQARGSTSNVNRYLHIYMNDQLALGIGWRELARRAQRSNEGTELGDVLTHVGQGIAEDVETFERIMRQLD